MNTNINYTFHDNEKDITLVLLHGWGQNIEMMLPI
jgi:predicted esterase